MAVRTPSVLMLSLLATILAGVAHAQDPAVEARRELTATLDKIVAIGRDADASPEEKRALIERQLEIVLDLGHMSMVALGPRVETFSAQQVAEFSQEFERYLIFVYLRRIGSFEEEKVEILETKLDSETGLVGIRTLGGKPFAFPGERVRHRPARAQVDYRMGKKNGEWRIFSISIGGVDLARNFRDQFQAILEKSSPDDLIAELRRRNAEQEAKNPFES
jgi:phospholipid transport system substrate-binding protein